MTSDNLKKRFITESALAADVASLIEPVIEDLGYQLVRVLVSQRDGMTLQIMADKPKGIFGIKDCGILSKELSPFLDSRDPVPGGYHLEISSPGIDRILVRPQDFINWQGFDVKIETKQLIDGRKRFKGEIAGYENDEVLIELRPEKDAEKHQKAPVTIGLNKSMIYSAKLILNDKLLNNAKKSTEKN